MWSLTDRFNSSTSSLGLDINVTTDLTTEPVGLVEMKNYLRVDYSLDDDLITMLIKAARKSLEDYTGCSFGDKGITITCVSLADISEIPCGPIKTITSVKSITDGAETELTTDDYTLIGEVFKKIRIHSNVGQSFEITYTAGYEELPSDLKLAIMQQVAFMYENRGDTTGGLVTAAQKLARQYMRNPFSI